MKSEQKQVSVRFTAKEFLMIEQAVRRGHGLSAADFVRTATREKIAELAIPDSDGRTTQVIFGGGA